ncbi:MAG TPA: hypothetical protein VFT74_12520 [Isosphaeraceae bacterium]|nr:hypothetical protein [Isosphaeraceae bacterium]
MSRAWLLLTIAALGSNLGRAEHALVQLDVQTDSGTETARVDQTPPEFGKNPRPVAHARAGESVRVKYLLTNVYPHKTLPDVVVHFYVARIHQPGEKPLPDLEAEGVRVLETAFDMDFRPGGHAGARATLPPLKPGVYLIRVETRNTQSDHEHFAAIDLVVDP